MLYHKTLPSVFEYSNAGARAATKCSFLSLFRFEMASRKTHLMLSQSKPVVSLMKLLARASSWSDALDAYHHLERRRAPLQFQHRWLLYNRLLNEGSPSIAENFYAESVYSNEHCPPRERLGLLSSHIQQLVRHNKTEEAGEMLRALLESKSLSNCGSDRAFEGLADSCTSLIAEEFRILAEQWRQFQGRFQGHSGTVWRPTNSCSIDASPAVRTLFWLQLYRDVVAFFRGRGMHGFERILLTISKQFLHVASMCVRSTCAGKECIWVGNLSIDLLGRTVAEPLVQECVEVASERLEGIKDAVACMRLSAHIPASASSEAAERVLCKCGPETGAFLDALAAQSDIVYPRAFVFQAVRTAPSVKSTIIEFLSAQLNRSCEDNDAQDILHGYMTIAPTSAIRGSVLGKWIVQSQGGRTTLRIHAAADWLGRYGNSRVLIACVRECHSHQQFTEIVTVARMLLGTHRNLSILCIKAFLHCKWRAKDIAAIFDAVCAIPIDALDEPLATQLLFRCMELVEAHRQNTAEDLETWVQKLILNVTRHFSCLSFLLSHEEVVTPMMLNWLVAACNMTWLNASRWISTAHAAAPHGQCADLRTVSLLKLLPVAGELAQHESTCTLAIDVLECEPSGKTTGEISAVALHYWRNNGTSAAIKSAVVLPQKKMELLALQCTRNCAVNPGDVNHVAVELLELNRWDVSSAQVTVRSIEVLLGDRALRQQCLHHCSRVLKKLAPYVPHCVEVAMNLLHS